MFWRFLQEQIQNWRFGNQLYQNLTPIVSAGCIKMGTIFHNQFFY
jgi:hypothetical protein